jgi:hypothetical protein
MTGKPKLRKCPDVSNLREREGEGEFKKMEGKNDNNASS